MYGRYNNEFPGGDFDRWLTTQPEDDELEDTPEDDPAETDSWPPLTYEDDPADAETAVDPLDLLDAAISAGNVAEVQRLIPLVGFIATARAFREWEERHGVRLVGFGK